MGKHAKRSHRAVRGKAEPKAAPVEDRPPPPVIHPLPPPGAGTPLTPADLEQAAATLNVDIPAMKAVATVESRGSGFVGGRPKILFELHYFRKFTDGKYDRSHPHLSAPYSSKKVRKASYHKDQWVVLQEAYDLDADAAIRSCSWGMFEVMGAFHDMGGWSDSESFMRDMFVSETQHLRLFIGYCRETHLVGYLGKHDWRGFASHYNGPDYRVNQYDTKLARAFVQFGGTPPPGRGGKAKKKGRRR